MVRVQYLTEKDEVRLVSEEVLCSSYGDDKKHFLLLLQLFSSLHM